MLTGLRVAVIVCSDRAYEGTYTDRSGPTAAITLSEMGAEVMGPFLIADDSEELAWQVRSAGDECDIVLVSGGTGLGPRDVTPQTLDGICDYQVPGIGEMLRAESIQYSLNACLSRCGGWVLGRSLVLAVPGSPKAVVEQINIISDLLPHAVKALRGECAHRRRTDDDSLSEGT